jgi:N utilization substance protein B
MSRQTARESVMRLLFETEFNIDFDTDTTLELMQPLDLTKNDRAFMDSLREGIFANLDAVDALIEKYARDWSLERMAKVDKSILRLAIYEMKYADTPEAIAINEAVNMARVFSSEESSSFINGILGAISRAEQEAE